MRTTITIDDSLLARARRVASRNGKTLSALIGDALRAELARRQKPTSEAFRLVTFRGSGGRPEVDLDRTSALMVAEDEGQWSSVPRSRRKCDDPA